MEVVLRVMFICMLMLIAELPIIAVALLIPRVHIYSGCRMVKHKFIMMLIVRVWDFMLVAPLFLVQKVIFVPTK